ncbi:MAG: epoxyqueuosine reductase QueH [Pseudomonadota bacterium]|nr:epoxyqueuosine reductase QueH [Pseudomonadota bacterium]
MTVPLLSPPGGERRILLHSCCAPCSGSIIETLVASQIDCSVFFYNPNIQPRQEYERRKAENKRFAKQHQLNFIDADYDSDHWFIRVKGLEYEPERGQRCRQCFDMRLERTALYAHEQGFHMFTSSLALSRWKDRQHVNESGTRAAARYPGLSYWTYNWRQQGGSELSRTIAQREHFYQQQYCGCVYSLRDTNQRRQQQGRVLIKVAK